MLGWVGDVERETLANASFRRVVFTAGNLQLTVMSIPPGGEIGLEMHEGVDQFLRVEQGRGRVLFGASREALDQGHDVSDGWAVIVPAGVSHNVVNTGGDDLRLYSLYAPPEHPDGTVHQTKAESDAAEH